MFFDIAQGMQRKGHEVRVITSNSGGIQGYKKYEGLDVWYYNWKILFGHPFLRESDLKEHLIWADVIHTSTITPGPVVCKATHKLGKKCIITVHEVLGKRWNWIESNPLLRVGYYGVERYVVTRNYDAYHVNSNATKNDLDKLNVACPVKTIYLPVEEVKYEKEEDSVSNFFGIEPDKKVFLFYGRPGQSKGIFVYLEAIKHLVKVENNRIENARFCFVMSDDPKRQKDKFCRLIKKWNLERYVKVEKSVKRDKLFTLISDADYVVVPSITEGFGFSAVEACFMDKRLICSNAGSLPEVVFGDVCFFENRDSRDLANVLHRILRGEDVFCKIPRKDYSLMPLVQEMEEFYNKYGITNMT